MFIILKDCSKWYQSSIFRLDNATQDESQDARKADKPNNPEQAQVYDQIQQQLNDTRAYTNIRFHELKEVLDALVFRVDSILQNTQLSASETNPHKVPQ